MMPKLFLSTTLIFLSACSTISKNTPTVHEMVYPVGSNYEEHDDKNYDMTYSKPLPKFVRTAEVPQNQMSAKHSDEAWISLQEPSHSTILIKNDANPLKVSQSLMNLPKNERTAVVKYQYQGQAHYVSLYGSYADSLTASQALASLPAETQSEAKVINWSQIQDLDTN